MSELGDRLREAADLCDKNEKMTCAGIVAKPNETVVFVFTDTPDDCERHIAMLIANGLVTAPVDRDYRPFETLEP
jgi:hypothetical protein